jgi:chromosome segregation ATPase
MSQANEENQSNEFKNDASSSRVRNGSELDKAFPSTLTLGFLVIMVITLSLVTGWKVVNLGLEKAELERDLKTNKAIREEIPRLQTEENELRKKRDQIKSEKETQEIEYKILLENQKRAQKDLTNLNSIRDSQESEFTRKEKRLTEMQAKLMAASNDHDNLSGRLKAKKILEKTLQGNIDTFNSEIIELKAKESGLILEQEKMQEIRNRMQQELKSIEENREDMRKLSDDFSEVAANMKRSRDSIESEIRQLATATRGLESEQQVLIKAADSISDKSREIDSVVSQVEAIRRNFKTTQGKLGESISESQDQIRSLKEIINKESVQLRKNIQKNDDNIDGFEASLKGVQRVTAEYEDNLKTLQDKLTIAEQTSNSMKSLESSLMEQKNKITSNADNFDGLFAQVNNQFKNFNQNLDHTLNQVNDKYKKADKDLAQFISRAKENNKKIDDQEQRIVKGLEEVKEVKEVKEQFEKKLGLWEKTLESFKSLIGQSKK